MVTRALVRAGLVVAAIVAAGWQIVPSTARASFPGAPGRFVFDGFRGFDYSLLWDWTPRTSRPRQLTHTTPTCGPHSDRENDTWYDSAPKYSPNGRTIAYLHEDTCPGGESRRGLWLME